MKTRLFLLSFIVLLSWLLYPTRGHAAVKLPYFFADSMVLQQKMDVPVWGTAIPGKIIRINVSWNTAKYETTADSAGKWRIKVATPEAGGPYEMTISDGTKLTIRNILIGEVWICAGQSNMEMPMKGFRGQPVVGSNDAVIKSANKNIRLFTVPRVSTTTPQDNSREAHWLQAGPEAVSKFSATGYYFGRLIEEMRQVPVGLITVSYGGSPIEAWMDAVVLQAFPEIIVPAATDSIKVVNRTPTTLYNGMMHPVTGYGIRGFLWYQGETNYDKPDQYEQLLPTAVKQWRKLWGQGNFPFYYAQIAPYNYEQLPPYNKGGKFNSAYLRDAQRKSEKLIPNSAMAVLMDVGEEACIHPSHKQPGGERLAYLALAKTYGMKGFGAASPAFDSLIVKDTMATLKFTNAINGFTTFGKPLSSFEIAGSDHVFYPAKAAINGTTINVSAPEVRHPLAVRYAFRDFIVGELYGIDGLPVSSFRTDNW